MGEIKIDWIGDIPKRWSLRKIGQMYIERREKVNDIDYPPLSVTMKGILPQVEGVAKTDAHNDRKLVRKGDFAINSRSDRRGACGIAAQDGSVSLINIVLEPREGMNPSYLNWLFHTSMFADEFYRNGQGIVDDMWTTKWSDMKSIYIPFPPLPEQSRIASFLDDRCAKIDEAIKRCKEMNEKFDEYRKAVITKAVTKGVRGERVMKASKLNDFLNEVPNEWEVKRFKFVCERLMKGNGITKDEVFSDGDTPCVRYGEIYSKYENNFIDCISKTYLSFQTSPKWFEYGFLLFAGTGELVEEIGRNIVYLGNKTCLAGGDIIIAKTNQNPSFVNYAMNSHYAQAQKSKGKVKLKVVHISSSEIGDVVLALPPLIEQSEIVAFLDKRCAEINSAKEKNEAMVKKLEEYKKSLIYHAVTGKIEFKLKLLI